MGEKDLTEKILEDYNDVFADIINAIIFKGEQKILPDSLQKWLTDAEIEMFQSDFKVVAR